MGSTAAARQTSMFLLDRDMRILIAEGEGVPGLPWVDDGMFRGRMVVDLQDQLPATSWRWRWSPTAARSPANAESSSSPAQG
jgi:hypothetical protein